MYFPTVSDSLPTLFRSVTFQFVAVAIGDRHWLRAVPPLRPKPLVYTSPLGQVAYVSRNTYTMGYAAARGPPAAAMSLFKKPPIVEYVPVTLLRTFLADCFIQVPFFRYATVCSGDTIPRVTHHVSPTHTPCHQRIPQVTSANPASPTQAANTLLAHSCASGEVGGG